LARDCDINYRLVLSVSITESILIRIPTKISARSISVLALLFDGNVSVDGFLPKHNRLVVLS